MANQAFSVPNKNLPNAPKPANQLSETSSKTSENNLADQILPNDGNTAEVSSTLAENPTLNDLDKNKDMAGAKTIRLRKRPVNTAFSIKNELKAKEKEENEKNEHNEKGSDFPADPVDAEEVLSYWDRYVSSQKSKTVLFSALSEVRMQAVEDLNFLLEFPSAAGSYEFSLVKPKFLLEMREHFNNFYIHVDEKVAEETTNKNYILNTEELYKAIIDSNEEAEDFIKILGLKVKKNN